MPSPLLEGQLAACRQENKKLREDYEKVVKGEARAAARDRGASQGERHAHRAGGSVQGQ